MLSIDGHQYYVVTYDYDNNFIEAREVSDLKDETIVDAVQQIFDKMEEHGHTPKLNVTDNQAARPLKACLLYTSPSPRDRQKSRMPSSA